MMKNLFGFVILFIYTIDLFGARDPKYPLSDIPDNLKENAHIVYRLKKAEFVIEDIDRAKYIVHEAITILNESGKGHAIIGTSYDKLRKVTNFSATVYDKNGYEIDKLKKSDIIDRSYIDGGTLFDDNRVMTANLHQDTYPYTVEYEIEISFKYLFHIPDWVVLRGENDAVQLSEFIIRAPESLLPRYKLLNSAPDPKKNIVNGITEYSWKFENFKAVEYETLSRGYMDVSPIIRVGVSKFKFDEYEGSMKTWDDFALWQNELNKGRGVLSEERTQELKSLVADKAGIPEKIRTVYEYMQKRTRYVSIQLGIGGFQPFESQLVDEVGYGDCKALTFYTQSLLREVGIDSYYTLIYGGSNPPDIYEDFPNNNYFNHVILCVPVENDTIWLECTSQTNPMGYLGSFTGDRDAFVVSKKGGKIVHTPVYSDEQNAIETNAKISISPEGDATASVNSNFIGRGYEHNGLHYYIKLTENEHREWLTEYLDISNYKIDKYNFTSKGALIPEVNLELNLIIRKLASISGKRIFLQPNLLNVNSYVPPKLEKRNTPVYIQSSKLWKDSIVYEFPQSAHIEYLPDPVELVSPFGSLNVEYHKNEDGTLLYVRELRLKKGKYEPEQYGQLIDFYKEVSKADKKKVILMKST